MPTYIVTYETKCGAHMLKRFGTHRQMRDEILRLHTRRQEATAYIDQVAEDNVIGAVWKMNGFWNWYTG